MLLIKIADRGDYPDVVSGGDVISAFPLTAASKSKLNAIKNTKERELSFLAELIRLRLLAACGISQDSPLEYGAHGKPYIKQRYDIAYNLSHSGSLAVGAVLFDAASQNADVISRLELGIDIQQIDRSYKTERRRRIAERHYTACERAYIDASADPAREFFIIWSKKEAYIKYTGEGLSHPLCEIDTAHDMTPSLSCSVGGAFISSRTVGDFAGEEYAFSICLHERYAYEAEKAEIIKERLYIPESDT